jgi:serine phosphatase RsbU (regulator of sigma subunit)
VTVDPPLGVVDAWPRTATTVQLEPGSLLFLYTDGLVERRHASIDEGLAQLCEVVEPASPGLACAMVVRALIGRAVHDDDVAVLAIRRTSTS